MKSIVTSRALFITATVIAVAVGSYFLYTELFVRPRQIQTLPLRGAGPLAFSHDGKLLVASVNDIYFNDAGDKYFGGELSIWDWSNGEKLHSIKLPQVIRSTLISAKGDLLVVVIGTRAFKNPKFENSGKPREIRLYSFPEMKESARIELERPVHSAALSPDGKLLVTSTARDDAFYGEVIVWETEPLKKKYTIDAKSLLARRVRFAPDGTRFAVDERGDRFEVTQVREYRTADGKELGVIARLERAGNVDIDDFHYLPDGKHLVVNKWHMSLVEIATGKETEISDGERFSSLMSRSSVLSDDGSWLAVYQSREKSGKSARQWIWDTRAKKMRCELQAQGGAYVSGIMAFSHDGSTFAHGGEKVVIFDMRK